MSVTMRINSVINKVLLKITVILECRIDRLFWINCTETYRDVGGGSPHPKEAEREKWSEEVMN
jgi:hypothetical protein